MSAHLPHDHSMTSIASSLARQWCQGHDIGGEPALSHALRVAQTLAHHHPDADPALVAAALVHDAPDFARPGDDVDTILTHHLSARVAHIVRELAKEHLDLAAGDHVLPTDPAVALVSAADKLVSVNTVLDRAAASSDPAAYWRRHRSFIAAIPYFRSFIEAGSVHLPATMTQELGRLLDEAAWTIRRCRIAGNES